MYFTLPKTMLISLPMPDGFLEWLFNTLRNVIVRSLLTIGSKFLFHFHHIISMYSFKFMYCMKTLKKKKSLLSI